MEIKKVSEAGYGQLASGRGDFRVQGCAQSGCRPVVREIEQAYLECGLARSEAILLAAALNNLRGTIAGPATGIFPAHTISKNREPRTGFPLYEEQKAKDAL